MPEQYTAPEFYNSEIGRQAVALLTTVKAEKDAEYKWVSDYAKIVWDDYNKACAALDEKAESIIKYLGGGTGLFVLGVLSKVDASNRHIAAWTLPAIACALIAMFLAMRAKKPAAYPCLPPVRQAKTYADSHKIEGTATAIFLAQWNLACEKAQFSCDRKAALVARAAYAAYSTLILLLIPLTVTLIWPPCAK